MCRLETNSAQFSETVNSIEQSTVSLKEIEEALLQLLHSKEDEEKKLNEADQAYYNFRNELASPLSSPVGALRLHPSLCPHPPGTVSPHKLAPLAGSEDLPTSRCAGNLLNTYLFKFVCENFI